MSAETTITPITTVAAEQDEYGDECDCSCCLDEPLTLADALIDPTMVWIRREASRVLVCDRFVILDATRAQFGDLPGQDGLYDLTDPHHHPGPYGGCETGFLDSLWEQATGPRAGADPGPVTWSAWSCNGKRVGFLPGNSLVAADDAWLTRAHWNLSGGHGGTTLLISDPHTGQTCGAIARATLPDAPEVKPILAAITAQAAATGRPV
ncbi:hypothetical protein Aple_051090 [Acrocarpospora pleiomorpha]|uniref:Uncharacterized protein n=1 Tax=Acrocarpospora pleiomorpha TaxID=90975 RepID=A0A5M3XMS6_9ACTN|nr:hypothetical protein [Acrocarpospora pleiomorpha]GES22212.1 hypothetical protein Aple_051090 [Acrocarpospora pleiomorpha]